MTRNIWIPSALLFAGVMLVLAPAPALAGSPLLSGYGGPGAGEQVVIGSTLIGGSRGGSSGSGGAGGSGEASGSTGTSTSPGDGASSTGSGSTGSSKVGPANGGSGSGSHGGASGGAANSRTRSGRATGTGDGTAGAYVYPTSQGSVPSASLFSGISSGAVLLLIGILATLGLIALLTLRLSRLQS